MNSKIITTNETSIWEIYIYYTLINPPFKASINFDISLLIK